MDIMLQKYTHGMETTLSEVLARVVSFAATNDKKWEDKFLREMSSLRFLPAGRILAGAGTNRKKSTLSNCFVMEAVPDSMVGIMQVLNESALTMQSGGGIGVDFSLLRPKGDKVVGTDSKSSGPISFMGMWDAMCQTVAAAGNRRGAMMGVMRIDHPDIESFITAKQRNTTDNPVLSQFNLSIAITDEFIEAVNNNAEFNLKFNGQVYKTVSAKWLYKKIITNNHEKAEPGILFIDTINKQNSLRYCEYISATNPCGEQPLSPYSSCNLGAINITQFIHSPFGGKAAIDYQQLEHTTSIAVRFLDNILDLNYFPLQKQKQETLNKRKIGLGIMGLGSALSMLNIKYGTEKSIQVTEKIMRTIRNTAYNTSVQLSQERGAFPLFDASKYIQGEFIKSLPDDIKKNIKEHGIRNSHLLTIAPTGSISQLVGNVSGGVEPIFSLQYTRKLYGKDTIVRDYAYNEYLRLHPEGAIPEGFVSTHDLTADQHLKIMSICQKYVDSAISKTINLPKDISVDEMEKIYLQAYEQGCKGCTTYREGSLDGEILKKKTPKNLSSSRKENGSYSYTRAYGLEGQTFKVKLPEQKHAYYLTFTHEVQNGVKRPVELFINTKDPFVEEWTKSLGRLVSAIFRNTESPVFVVEELKEVFSQSGFFSSQRRKFVPSLIAEFGEVMEDYFTNIGIIEKVPIEIYAEELNELNGAAKNKKLAYCSACGQNALIYEEGCLKCLNCAYNKCS